MKRIAALLLLALAGWAQAGTLGLHIGSQHFPAQQYNNFNPGAYYIHDNGATVGTYYNSERRQSVYAGWTWDSGPWRLQVGAITGYERRAVLPMVVPSVALGHGFRLTALPKVAGGSEQAESPEWMPASSMCSMTPPR